MSVHITGQTTDAWLYAEPKGTGLNLFSSNGPDDQPRVRLALSAKEGQRLNIDFLGLEGGPGLMAVQAPTGPALKLSDRRVLRSFMAVDPRGSPIWSIHDSRGKSVEEFRVDGDGSPLIRLGLSGFR